MREMHLHRENEKILIPTIMLNTTRQLQLATDKCDTLNIRSKITPGNTLQMYVDLFEPKNIGEMSVYFI